MPRARRFIAFRFMLEIAIIPITCIAFYALFVGLTFGFRLWRTDAPVVTLLWLGIVLAPGWFCGLLKWSQCSETKTMVVLGGLVAIVGWATLLA